MSQEMSQDVARARILMVDDQEANLDLLERILRAGGYRDITSLTDSRKALDFFQNLHPDLLLLDLHMPHLDGFAVLELVRREIPAGIYLPILMLTADLTPEVKRQALAGGAKDFLSKPFDSTEVLLRIQNLLETRFLHLLMEEKVRSRTLELVESEEEALKRLALAAEFRDDDTAMHTERVGQRSGSVAVALGWAETEVELLRKAAPLHDLGKIGISDLILLKPGQLTPEEWTLMQTHTSIGSRMLGNSRFPLYQMAEQIARTHHERWDGTGYPAGLKGPSIPLSGRIVAVTDVFDALTHERPYKKAWPVAEARDEMKQQSGRQFDPDVVRAFLEVLDREEGQD
jgi:putative two-component system response regulator